MTEEQPQPERHGRPLGMVALLVIVAIGILAILWGRFVVNPEIEVFLFNAGPVESFEVGEPVYFPSVQIYVIAVDDDGSRKMVRAIDARAPGTGCTVQLNVDDPRGESRNPLGRPGTFTGTCSNGVWALTGAAIEATQPLHRFLITRPEPVDEEGRPLIEVEVIGRSEPSPTPGAR